MQLSVPAVSGAWLPPLLGGESVELPAALPLAATWPADVLPALPLLTEERSSFAVDTAQYDVSHTEPGQVSTLPASVTRSIRVSMLTVRKAMHSLREVIARMGPSYSTQSGFWKRHTRRSCTSLRQ